ncbi:MULTISPECIES: diaminopimelate decarboxylase [Acinetobacter]|uniref:diaminopimelate decarboxylase n=1 Tax=Acinetobacter TaxID=469 RepID=UPI000D00AE18|nr:diaminopimelate decarboxylase [Acinetobacter sp. MYb10]QLD61254.1 diaminopimelate decarboxylase [Acinetobacter sp. MYb10]
MSFSRIHGVLHAEQCSLDQLAQQYGTPLYVYSKATFEKHYLDMDQAFSFIDHQICFAVKSNSNLAVLNVLAKLGSGFDIVTGGELARVLAAGGDATKIVFSGLGKQEADIQKALEVGIACFNVESHAELDRIQKVAAGLGKKAPISLRVNPDVDAKTHPYISTGLKENKFGIPSDSVFETYQYAASLPNLDVIGIDCHIGSQLTETQPFVDALDRVIMMIAKLKELGIQLKHIDIGGGLGVTYKDETPPSVAEYANAMRPALEKLGLKVYMEPGRSISANAGVLVTKVDLLKPTNYRNFAIIDAAMNDLIRPSLYQAWMDIQPVISRIDFEAKTWDIVGAICETGDFLGKERELAIQENDNLAVLGAGAYGFVMSSNYNSRGRAAEVMVDADQSYVIRKRETIESLWENESLLP